MQQKSQEFTKIKYPSETDKKNSDLESISQSFAHQFSSIRAKVSNIMDQMWGVSGSKTNAIHLNLKQLNECVPVLESGIIDFVGEMGFWRSLSNSQKEEIKNLQDLLTLFMNKFFYLD